MIMPATQQSMLLLHQHGGDGVLYRDRSTKGVSDRWGALASTINILVLDNPMQFQFSQFLDSALGQIVGCFLALMVILIVRDNSGPEPVGCC